MKPLIYVSLLIVIGCTTATSPSLEEKEKALVGYWSKPVDNYPLVASYMEFRDDRTGLFGPAMNIRGKVGLASYMAFTMKDWRIKSDTLSILYKLEGGPGYEFIGPDGKKIENDNKPNYAHFIISEVSDSVIVLQELLGEFPVTDRLKKSEKLELFEE